MGCVIYLFTERKRSIDKESDSENFRIVFWFDNRSCKFIPNTNNLK